MGTSTKAAFESPRPLVQRSRDNIRELRNRKNVKVYIKVDSTPLKRKELKVSPGENVTFLAESSPSNLSQNFLESVESVKESVQSLKQKL